MIGAGMIEGSVVTHTGIGPITTVTGLTPTIGRMHPITTVTGPMHITDILMAIMAMSNPESAWDSRSERFVQRGSSFGEVPPR